MPHPLVELSPDAVFVHSGFAIVYANNATATLLGFERPGCLIGQSPLQFIRVDFQHEARSRIEAVVSAGLSNPAMEQVWVRRDGGEVSVSVASARISWHGHDAVLVCVRDVTEQKRILHEAEQARQKAERATQSKSRLIAAVSHDLRQPLQSLALFASVIDADPNIGQPSRVALSHLRATVDRMGQLLGSVLELAKIDSGLVTSRKQPVHLGPLFSQLVEEMTPQANAKRLSLKYVPTSAVGKTDAVLILAILRNLVANAIRYTEKGTVLIGCRRHGNQYEVGVYDTGIGIDPQHLSVIFDEFYQVGNKARDSNLGLGLGLSIVQRLARLLGHRVTVRSNKNRGSAFCLIVPGASVP